MAWETSNRKAELPRDWAAIRKIVLARDGYACQAQVAGRRCGAPANQVDHIVRGNDHRPVALQSLCRACHARKSSAEGNAARHRRRRDPEPHPGLL